jgi:hypothetical protein
MSIPSNISNASSLVSSTTLSNLNNLSVPKAFGDQLKNKAKEKIVKPVTDELTKLLEEKKDLIAEEIRLEAEHQKRLLELQAQKIAGSISNEFSSNPEPPTEQEIEAVKPDYITFYKANPGKDDGYDLFYYGRVESIPVSTTKKTIKAWLIYLPGSPPPDNEPAEIIEEDVLPSQMKKRVDEGKRIAVLDNNYVVEEADNTPRQKFSSIVKTLQNRYWDNQARALKPGI